MSQQKQNLFPGVGQAVGRGSDSTPTRSSSTGRGGTPTGGGGGGGGGSRDHTPVIARYAVLSAAVGVASMEQSPVVVHGTVVEGRGVTSSVVASALLLEGGGDNTAGQPRNSTPARLSRVLTPLKGRRLTSLLGGGAITTLADLQAREEEAAAAATAQRRIERRSRRKMRRWANDRLIGVAQLSGGGAAVDDEVAAAAAEGQYGPCLDVFEPLHSNFATLNAVENSELRDRFLAGYGDAKRGGGHHHAHGGGHHTRRTRSSRTSLQEAEARFLRLERRLRGLLTQLVANDPNMEAFLVAVEALLVGFLQGQPLPQDSALPEALARSLAEPLHLQRGQDVLVLPLKNSAFFRLLVHGCCQFYGLKSHSENLTPEQRAVLVAKPATLGASAVAPAMSMCTFIQRHRLNQHLVPKHKDGRCLNEATEEERVAALAVAPVPPKVVA